MSTEKETTIVDTPGRVSSDSPHSDPELGVKSKTPFTGTGNVGYAEAVRSENWVTRNGLNAESFQMRSYGVGLVELDRSMKKRHLQMIAIGKLNYRTDWNTR